MRDRDAELREEIKAHLDMATADRVDRGEAPGDAAAAARRELGNLSQIQEATRDVWGRRWLEQAAQDVRYALRTFRRTPGFAVVAILSLALGIGANTALFEVVNAVRLRALPIADPARLVEVRILDTTGARGSFESWYPAVTQPIWRQIQLHRNAFTGLFAWGRGRFSLSEGGEAVTADGLWVSGEFFTTLGLTPAAGRLLSTEDDRPGCTPRAVLSHGMWRRVYGGDHSAIGRTITLDSKPVEIVGVAPAPFHGLEVGRQFDVALPLCAEPAFSSDGKGRVDAGTTWWLGVFGRLKPGWTIDRVSAELAAASPAAVRASLPSTYPSASVDRYLAFTLGAVPGGSGLSQLRENYASPLWLLLAIAGVVLVIACANLANLLLARASAREREIAIRLGMGASRGRVIRQLLTESLLLAAIGGVAATLLAGALSRAFVSLLDAAGTSTALTLDADWRVLAFTTALSLLTCLLFGLAPALNATRVSASSVMRATARGATAGRDAVGLRRGLVVAQVALSVVLLFGSLLFARSLRNLVTMDPGFRSDGVVSAGIDFRRLDLPPDRRAAFKRELLGRVRALPGIEGAATTRIVPVSGNAWGNTVWPEGNPSAAFGTRFNAVGPGFFATLGTPMLAGRDFADSDTQQSAGVAVVNEAFAARMALNGRTVVGSRFTREATPSSPSHSVEIIGVVKNAKYASL